MIPIDSYFSDALVQPPTSRKATSFWWSNFESWSPFAFHVYVHQNQEKEFSFLYIHPGVFLQLKYLQWNVLKIELCRYMLFTPGWFCILLWLPTFYHPPKKIHRYHHFREITQLWLNVLGFSRRRFRSVCFFSMKASHGAGVVNAFGLALFRYLSKTESEKLSESWWKFVEILWPIGSPYGIFTYIYQNQPFM